MRARGQVARRVAVSTDARSLRRWPLARILAAAVPLAVVTLTGCRADDDTLPGRSRPVFEHGWPDPGELALGPAVFTPPDPGEALFETSSGVRAYVVPAAASDPLVRLTAALPLGRLHEADGETGASALLTRLMTTRGPAGASRPLSLRLAERERR